MKRLKQEDIREVCAKIIEKMVVTHGAWSEEQRLVSNALLDAASNLRDDNIFNAVKVEYEN